MSMLLERLAAREALPFVDAQSLEAFFAPRPGRPAHVLLFFAGDEKLRPETLDVAVILPELLATFAGRLEAAIVAPEAVEALKGRFQVYALPSLVVARESAPVAVLPKVYDWSDYLVRIEAALAPDAPIVVGGRKPAVEISHSHDGAVA